MPKQVVKCQARGGVLTCRDPRCPEKVHAASLFAAEMQREQISAAKHGDRPRNVYGAVPSDTIGPEHARNVELLSERFMLLSAATVRKQMEEYPPPPSYLLDATIDQVAHYTPQDTIYDILRAEDEFESISGQEVGMLRMVVDLWQDRAALFADERNLMLPPPANSPWQRTLKRHLARALVLHGSIMRDGDTFYGWEDYDRNHGELKQPVAGVFRVWEDSWDEFEGTFTDAGHRDGVTGEVLLGDGSVHLMRWETETSELLREVLNP